MIRRKKIKKAAVLLSTGMLAMTVAPVTAFADNESAWQYRASQIKDYLDTPLMQTGQVLAENNKIQYDSTPAVIEDSNKSSTVQVAAASSTGTTSVTGTTTSGSGNTGSANQTQSQTETQVHKDETPATQTVGLTETYHEDFEVYSESLGGYFFFYTNVGNNGITDQPVYIDLPQNITFTLQKDGVDIPYVSKQVLSDYGTYVLNIIAVRQPDTFDENPVCYVATFNFRIQERPVKPTEAETKAETSSGSSSSGSSYFGQNYQSDIYAGADNASRAVADAASKIVSDAASQVSESASKAVSDAASKAVSDAASKVSDAASGVADQITSSYDSLPWTAKGTESSSEGSAEDAENETLTDGETEDGNTSFSVGDDAIAGLDEEERNRRLEARAKKTGEPAQTYDSMSGLYTITYGELSSMTASVPNGILTNNSVSVNKDGLGATADKVTVLRNGSPYSWPAGDVFEDAGSYVILIPLVDKTRTFSFRILGSAESGISEYTLPENLTLTEVTLDGAVKPVSSYFDDNDVVRLHMEQEGLWQLTFTSDEGRDYYATLLIDHTPPQFDVSVSGGKATFSYDRSDVASVVINDGKSDSTFDELAEWTTPGRYTVTAYDEAGNSTQVSFVLKKKVNPAGIIAAILAVVLLAGGIWYFKRTKENMDVK